jgi:hypothetical protein
MNYCQIANKANSVMLPVDLKEMITGADEKILRKAMSLFVFLTGRSLRPLSFVSKQ